MIHDSGMPMMGLFGWVFMLLIWGLLIAGIIYLFRFFSSRRKSTPSEQPERTPLDILKVRYAKGEISEEDFNRMKEDLE